MNKLKNDEKIQNYILSILYSIDSFFIIFNLSIPMCILTGIIAIVQLFSLIFINSIAVCKNEQEKKRINISKRIYRLGLFLFAIALFFHSLT